MGFVGITDEYALTVCLWHMRYGGDCSSIEFDDVRPGSNRTATKYDTSYFTEESRAVLLDEEAVYDRAKARFWRDVRDFNATAANCARLCGEAFFVQGAS